MLPEKVSFHMLSHVLNKPERLELQIAWNFNASFMYQCRYSRYKYIHARNLNFLSRITYPTPVRLTPFTKASRF